MGQRTSGAGTMRERVEVEQSYSGEIPERLTAKTHTHTRTHSTDSTYCVHTQPYYSDNSSLLSDMKRSKATLSRFFSNSFYVCGLCRAVCVPVQVCVQNVCVFTYFSKLAHDLQSVCTFCPCVLRVCQHVCPRAYPDICLLTLCVCICVRICVYACVCVHTRQWCAMPLTKQVGWMSMGCDSDNTTPHYQVTPAETGRERGERQVGWQR